MPTRTQPVDSETQWPGRVPERIFSPYLNRRPHYPWGALACWKIISGFGLELAANLPRLLELRREYRRRPRPHEPVVAVICDNLDEVNGIAMSSRIMLRKLRGLGKRVFLVGVAFHSREARIEGDDGSVI